MAQVQTRPPRLSFEDYLELERKSDVRYEFIDGVLFAMVGATDRHELIAMNLASALHAHLRRRCQVFKSDMKVKIPGKSEDNAYYPDIFASCDPGDRSPLWREKPCLIVEVASPSTAAFDRGAKFDEYRKIDALQEYVIVAQDLARVEIFRRHAGWKADTLALGDVLNLDSVGFNCPVAEIYEGVEPPREHSV